MEYLDYNDSCLCFRVCKLSRAMVKHFNFYVEQVGITIHQLHILSEIKISSGMSQVEIAEKMGMDRTTLSRCIKPLIKHGLIAVVSKQPPDKRERKYLLLQMGENALIEAMPKWFEARRMLSEIVSPATQRAMFSRLCNLKNAEEAILSDG